MEDLNLSLSEIIKKGVKVAERKNRLQQLSSYKDSKLELFYDIQETLKINQIQYVGLVDSYRTDLYKSWYKQQKVSCGYEKFRYLLIDRKLCYSLRFA
jgi:hypothetical protein